MAGTRRKDRVPVKYQSAIDKSKLSYIKVSCTGADGEKVKEEIPKFTGEEEPEHFLLTITTLQTLINRYELMSNVGNQKLAFQTLSRCFSDDAL